MEKSLVIYKGFLINFWNFKAIFKCKNQFNVGLKKICSEKNLSDSCRQSFMRVVLLSLQIPFVSIWLQPL